MASYGTLWILSWMDLNPYCTRKLTWYWFNHLLSCCYWEHFINYYVKYLVSYCDVTMLQDYELKYKSTCTSDILKHCSYVVSKKGEYMYHTFYRMEKVKIQCLCQWYEYLRTLIKFISWNTTFFRTTTKWIIRGTSLLLQ